MDLYNFPSPPDKTSWRRKSIGERRSWKQEFYIDHPVVKTLFEDCRQKMHLCHETNRYDTVLVKGGTGSGKTTFCKQLSNYAEKVFHFDDPEVTVRPFIKIGIPDPCTPYELAFTILDALGDQTVVRRRRKAETIDAAGKLIQQCQVRLILVDDVQDIPARRGTRGIGLVGARLREYIDNSAALWVFLGTSDILKVVDSDPQLVKRICYRATIPYFSIGDDVGRNQFMRLLMHIDKWLPLAEPSCITEPQIAGLIHVATEGIFDRLVQLLDRAWHESVVTGRERIEPADLAHAFPFVFGLDASRLNPFAKEFSIRRLRAAGEPFEVLRGGE